MRTRIAACVLVAVSMVRPGPAARAQQASDPAELAFWQAASSSGNAAEYLAYLEAYPQGQFAPLARQFLKGLAPAASPQPARAPAPEPLHVALRPTHAAVRLTDGITLDLNAEPLQRGSNLRLTVVPAGTPDTVADPAALVADSTPIAPARLHVTIPSGPVGQDEVRLYYIPPFLAQYVLAGRAGVTVAPGAAGAVLTRDLAREIAQLGPIRFEAVHRDRPMLIQAAFLRVRPRTEWNTAWFGGALGGEPARRIIILSIGQPNVAPDLNGSTGEAICALSGDDTAILNRVANLQVGDPVTVAAIPTSWDNAGPSDPVLLDRCALR